MALKTDPFPEEHERLQELDLNHTRHGEPTANGHDDLIDIDKDISPLAPRLSSPTSSPSSSGSLPPFLVHVRYGRTTPPSPPSSRIQHGHTIPPLPDIPRERTIPPSLPCARRTTPSSPHSEVNRDSLPPPPPKRVRLPPAPFREGYTPGPKPKAMDYEQCVQKMLLKAMHEYACLVLSTDAFPNEVKQTQWAKATWQAACDEVGEHYECSVRMIRLVRLKYYCHSHIAEC